MVRWGRDIFSPGPKAAALLAFLAVEGVTSRERVLGQLWPDSPQKKAQGSLRYLLHSLKKSVTDLIDSSPTSLSLNSATQIDISMLNRASSPKERAAAAQLRRGEFCEGVQGISPEFEDWLEHQRQHWQGMTVDNLLELSASLPLEEGLKPARQAVLLDPLNESAHAQVIRLLMRQGEVAEAHRQLDRCRHHLREELGVEPSPATAKLLEVVDTPAARSNLPPQVRSIVGREASCAEVLEKLQEHRLLTLTGEGGIGKTTLALTAAQELKPEGGVWLLELANLRDGKMMEKELASVWGVNGLERLPARLTEQNTVLVLDNCEHLLDSSARLGHRLLNECRGLRILATSREPLKIPGERVMPLDPLENQDAVALFLARAHEAGARDLDDQEDTVAELCRRLDGLPLAIELAAARARGLTVAQLLEALDERFRLLRNSDRTADARQKTLAALIDWSYARLEAAEQQNFRTLAVFRSGFYLDTAVDVLGLDRWDTIDVMEALVDKSLLRTQAHGKGLRYYFLESLREYGWAKMEEAQELDSVRERHLCHFLNLAHSLCPLTRGERQRVFLDQLESERDNFRAALAFALQGQPSKALELAAALCPLWKVRDHREEGRAYLQSALDLTERTDPEWPRALLLRGELEIQQAECERAIASLKESLEMGRERARMDLVSRAAKGLGSAHFFLKKFEPSRTWFEEALSGFEELGDPTEAANCVNNLGMVSLYLKDFEQAQDLFEQSAERHRGGDDLLGLGVAIGNLAYVAEARGEVTLSRNLFLQALEHLNEVGALWNSAYFLEGFGKANLALGQLELAVRCLSVAEQLRRRLKTPRLPVEKENYTHLVERLREGLGPDAYDELWTAAAKENGREFLANLLDGAGVARD